ncbi:hypothetical protein AX15_004162 [Amanita polypyramis BW_CC]|nr:hypothetical protein AX15_004162 [Amanita polypyramis BW_CC]
MSNVGRDTERVERSSFSSSPSGTDKGTIHADIDLFARAIVWHLVPPLSKRANGRLQERDCHKQNDPSTTVPTMVSSTGQSLLSLVGWAIVPDYATQQLLRLLYSLFGSRFQKHTPHPSTSTYRKHYAYAFAVVVLSYLTYNLIQGVRYMPLNFYQMLGVPSTVDDAGLKLAFRQFAKYHHPDRPDVGKAGEELFMRVRDAFEALKDPTVRFAYDRFGPAVLTWKDCVIPGDYIRRGLLEAIGYHSIVGAALLFWSTIGQPSPISFWRYTFYATLFVTELALILSPSPHSASFGPMSLSGAPSIVSNAASSINTQGLQPTISPFTIFNVLLPSQVTHQHIQFLHQLFISLSVALSRVAPQLFPQGDPRVEVILLDRINTLLTHADRESSIALHTSLRSVSLPDTGTNKDQSQESPQKTRATFSRMRPLTNLSPSLVKTLSDEMENLIIEGSIRKEDVGPLRAAWEAALKRKRKSAIKVEKKSSKQESPVTNKSVSSYSEEQSEDDNKLHTTDEFR